MRTYLSEANLRRALLLAVPLTLMSVPRILEARMNPWVFVPAAYAAMTLVSGAATAWSRRGGMYGLFPEPRRLLTGAGAAMILGAILGLTYARTADPLVREFLAALPDRAFLNLRYPPTFHGRLALLLWSTGFETMFFQISAMSFFARLTDRRDVAWLCTAALRVALAWLQGHALGLEPLMPLLLVGAAFSSLLCGLLFALAGLPAAMVFVACAGLNVFLAP